MYISIYSSMAAALKAAHDKHASIRLDWKIQMTQHELTGEQLGFVAPCHAHLIKPTDTVVYIELLTWGPHACGDERASGTSSFSYYFGWVKESQNG